jgi:CheY-like chemotaxis protein
MLTILHVDDSATSRLLFRAHLPKDTEFIWREAENLRGALDAAAEIQPELIVLDYTMPDHNGVEVAQALIDDGHKGKLVLLSANIQQAVLEQTEALGFFKVLEKPITPEKISALIAEVVG